MEIFDEGPIITGTTSPTVETILGLRFLRKTRGVWDPHQINAKNGTSARRPLLFRTYRRHVEKNNSQGAEHDVPQALNQSKSVWHPWPLDFRPREKIQEQHQAQQLGTQKMNYKQSTISTFFLLLSLTLNPVRTQ